MIYLASPYSHPDELVQEARYKAARNYVHWSLLYLEDTVYSPIVHYHTLAELSGSTTFGCLPLPRRLMC
jgi:hypothetical protein